MHNRLKGVSSSQQEETLPGTLLKTYRHITSSSQYLLSRLDNTWLNTTTCPEQTSSPNQHHTNAQAISNR
jgi:hypothetical protein